MRPLLQQLAQLQKEHDGTGRIKVAPEHGDTDGHAVQQFHRHLPPPDTAQSPADIRQAAPRGIDRPQRGGQEELAQHAPAGHADQFFLILPIQRTVGVNVFQRRDLRGPERKPADLADQLLSFPPVTDDRAAGVVMDGDGGDVFLPLQPRLHLICLLHCHALDCQTDAHPSGVFMYNTEFHAIIFL